MTSRDKLFAGIAGVPHTLTRAHVEAMVTRFWDSYRTKDLPARYALYSDEFRARPRFEDPVGRPVADTFEAYQTWCEGVAANATILATIHRTVIIGDEALLDLTLNVSLGGSEPADLGAFVHFTFDDVGLIRSVRLFFDETTVA